MRRGACMRDLIIIAIILILVFGGGNWIDEYLQNMEDNLLYKIDTLHSQIKHNDMTHIEDVYELEDMWESSKTKWHILGNHQEIDEIEANLKKFTEAYEYGDQLESSLFISEVRFRINDMHKGDKLELANVL